MTDRRRRAVRIGGLVAPLVVVALSNAAAAGTVEVFINPDTGGRVSCEPEAPHLRYENSRDLFVTLPARPDARIGVAPESLRSQADCADRLRALHFVEAALVADADRPEPAGWLALAAGWWSGLPLTLRIGLGGLLGVGVFYGLIPLLRQRIRRWSGPS